jgi:nucleotide-binding universal stress UspA family protein
MTMRILLATDGSVSADHARDLVADASWPEGTEIRVVAALDISPALFGSPWIPAVPPDADRYEDEAVESFRDVLEKAAAALAAPGRIVQTELLRATPTLAVVEEMHKWAPDLTVVGSRGHGPVETTLLGSTCSAIIDHATAPVLVVRGRGLGHVILAEDGSDAARAAERLVTTWPLFADSLVDVVSVVDVAAPWRTGIAPAMFGNAMDVYTDMIASAHETQAAIAAQTAARLRGSGLRVEMELREGDPAGEIVAAAREDQADLVVIGSRGHTGIARLVLGGVAHGVLTHAPCSVLVVRDQHKPTA